VVGVVRNVNLLRVSAAADVWASHSTRKSQDFRRFHFAGEFSALLLARSRADFRGVKAEFRSRLELAKSQEGFEKLLGTPETRLEMLASAMRRKGRRRAADRSADLAVHRALLLFMPPPHSQPGQHQHEPDPGARLRDRSAQGVRRLGQGTGGQFILENIFLCLVGGVLALGGRRWCCTASAERSGPHLDVRLNYRVFLIALGVACFFGVLSGPCRLADVPSAPGEALRGGAR